MRSELHLRTYTQSHLDYVIEVAVEIARGAADLRGYKIDDEPPQLRHFTARFEPLWGVRHAQAAGALWPASLRHCVMRRRKRPPAAPSAGNCVAAWRKRQLDVPLSGIRAAR